MEQKADLVYSFTDHRTGSSREMKESEALDLVRHLRGVIDKQERQKHSQRGALTQRQQQPLQPQHDAWQRQQKWLLKPLLGSTL